MAMINENLYMLILSNNHYSVFFPLKADTEAPVCRQTNDITRVISLGSGNTGTPISWTEPTATDVCSQVTLVSRSHAPGDRFPVGSTRVSYTFADATGNRVTCSFNVIIEEGKSHIIIQIMNVYEFNGVIIFMS